MVCVWQKQPLPLNRTQYKNTAAFTSQKNIFIPISHPNTEDAFSVIVENEARMISFMYPVTWGEKTVEVLFKNIEPAAFASVNYSASAAIESASRPQTVIGGLGSHVSSSCLYSQNNPKVSIWSHNTWGEAQARCSYCSPLQHLLISTNKYLSTCFVLTFFHTGLYHFEGIKVPYWV